MNSLCRPRLLSFSRLLHLGFFASLLAFVSLARADLFVAPSALGTGNGSSAANAAGYQDMNFWNNTVQPALQSAAVTVWFANGTYSSTAQLTLTTLGHPLHACTLKATTAGSVTLTTVGVTVGGTTTYANNVLWLRGCENFVLDGLSFTGQSMQSALLLSHGGTPVKSGTRNVTVTNCTFSNMSNLLYGGILFGGNEGITISGCHFSNLTGTLADPTQKKHVHGLYTGSRSQGIAVLNCDFTDIGGEYVRFRDDTEYAVVDGCSFHSTSASWNNPFISVVLYNSISPYANEFFGTNYQFTNNIFRYDAPNANPPADSYCFAHYIYNSGFNAPPGDGLNYYITSSQATTLNTGTTAQKEAIFSGAMDLTNARFKIYNEEYHGATWATAYRAYPGSTTFNASAYSTNPVNVSNWPGTTGSLLTAPILRNAQFEFRGERLREWFTYSGPAPADHPGLNGTAKAIRLAKTANSEFGQPLRIPNASVVTLHWLLAVGARTGTGPKAKIEVYHNAVNNARLVVAVDDQGRVGYMNSSNTFVALSAAGAIATSIDANANGSYADAGDTLKWYQFRVTIDYSGATPKWDLAWANAANVSGNYANSAVGLTAWVGGSPVTGSPLSLLNFTNVTADMIVDEIW